MSVGRGEWGQETGRPPFGDSGQDRRDTLLYIYTGTRYRLQTEIELMSRHQTCIDPLTLNMSACSHTRLFAEWRHCWDGSQEVKMEVPARLMVSCLFVAGTVRSEIIKPWREWLCNYCAMGE